MCLEKQDHLVEGSGISDAIHSITGPTVEACQVRGPARCGALLGWAAVDDSAVYKRGKLLWSNVVDEKARL